MNVRKCNKGEMKNIIEVANASFIPDRDESFTFINSVAYIYNNPNCDYSDSHFVVEENNKMIALGGNLIDSFTIEGNNYKMSRVGTIGTLPEHRNLGYMRKIMNSIEEENINNDVVFSLLYGKRERYKHYGYEKACLFANYIFFKDQTKYMNNQYNVSIREYNDSDLDQLYSIYLSNQKLVLRSKENFILHLNNHFNKLYTFLVDNVVVGYYSIRDTQVVEIYFNDNKYLESALFSILDANDYPSVWIYVNMLNRELSREISKLSEYKLVNERWNIKVYDLLRFTKILFHLNDKCFDNMNSEVYKVEGSTLEFSANGRDLSVSYSNKTPLKEFNNKHEFIRFILGTDIIHDHNSSIFPLYIDVNLADKF